MTDAKAPEAEAAAPAGKSSTASKGRVSVLADGTTMDQDYFQSKNYILEQLQAKRQDGSQTEPQKKKTQKLDDTTEKMLGSGAVSKDDGWLLASMGTPMRNPFCVANHPARDQIRFYQKMFLFSSVFMMGVAVATIAWAFIWKDLMTNGNFAPILPCRGMGGGDSTFGVVRLCGNETEGGNTQGEEDGCDESAPLSVCVEDMCFNGEDDERIRDCWFLGAFTMVILCAYMMLLFRRDQAGKGLLSCACFIEGILGGAGTMHYDSSIFVEFFTYLCCTTILCVILMTFRSKKLLAEGGLWTSTQYDGQVGSLRTSTPLVETEVFKFIKINLLISAGVVTVISAIWQFGQIAKLTGGSDLAYIGAIIFLWVSQAWLIREISWTQHKFDPEQHVNMCISFHVDLYCMFILFLIFAFFTTQNACSQGPISCGPAFCNMMAQQCERCTRFGCGCNNRGGGQTEEELAAAAAAGGAAGVVAGAAAGGAAGGKMSVRKSVHVDKEVETHEQWKRRKMINAGCAFGILALGGIAFAQPMVSFGISLLICIFLPFFRAAQNKEEDHSNV